MMDFLTATASLQLFALFPQSLEEGVLLHDGLLRRHGLAVDEILQGFELRIVQADLLGTIDSTVQIVSRLSKAQGLPCFHLLKTGKHKALVAALGARFPAGPSSEVARATRHAEPKSCA